MWAELKRIIKPNGAIVLFGSEPFSSALRMSNIKMYKYDWIWEKSKASNFANVKYSPLKSHEIISIFSNRTHNYYPQMVKWHPYYKWIAKESIIEVYGDIKRKNNINNWFRFPRSVQYFRTAECEWKYSPTQKPVALIEYLIKTYTNEWETVLDFTIGSWTTAIACINTNRNYIGFELDKWYFDIANERIAWKLQNKK